MQDIKIGTLSVSGWEVRVMHSDTEEGKPVRPDPRAVGWAYVTSMEEAARIARRWDTRTVDAFGAYGWDASFKLNNGDGRDLHTYYVYFCPPGAADKVTLPVVEIPAPTPPTGYIIWNPAAVKPPKRVFKTDSAATTVASKMAKREPGEVFHVCAIVGTHKADPAPSPQLVATGMSALATALRGFATAMAMQALLRKENSPEDKDVTTRVTNLAVLWKPDEVVRALRWAYERDIKADWIVANRHITEPECNMLVRELVRADRMKKPWYMRVAPYRHLY